MRWLIWFLLALRLGAADPFAAYETSIGQRLDTMLAIEKPPPQAVPELAPAPPPGMIEAILLDEGVPRELAAVVQVESGGRLFALSPKGARGPWQFMPATARRYGLTVEGSADDRVHMARSTRAAARYLKDLYGRFGNWPLALAAYNAGEELVAKAVARTGSTEFSAISRLLPSETQKYVPAVLAAMGEPGRNAAGVDRMGQSGLAADLPLSLSKEAK
jgi:hypothetical protein